MRCSISFLVALLFLANAFYVQAQEKTGPAKKLANGIYAVLREGPKQNDLLPLKEGEVLAADRRLYQKKDEKEAPRHLVVRSTPDVELNLAAEPKAVIEGEEVVRILLKLQPNSAAALERLTTDRVGKQIAIVVDGEVVTVHKVRDVIKGGAAQISCCAPGSAKFLLEQLQKLQKSK
ncbi:MAG TPA: hypothetical protein VGZ47_20865 [Gemmataceae bacterium]|jgi:preprotein translocase subunit SecD|nr:hypothetical protein [Gemmataceae bacterium]